MIQRVLHSKGNLTQSVLALGMTDFDSVIKMVHKLPYGRNKNRYDLHLVLSEQKGTCSSKHAFLKQIAEENGFNDIHLILAIFKMNALNTPKIKLILEKYKIEYIPEAHCYLKIEDKRIDITFPETINQFASNELLFEEKISAEQVNQYKISFHKTYLATWIAKNKTEYSSKQFWAIREECINHLAQ